MKNIILAMLFGIITGSVQAVTVTWTNTSGGNWSGATNWSPNRIPGSGDDVVITGAGTYQIMLDTSVNLINSLVVGGSSGQQTLDTSAHSLAVTKAVVVNVNGILELDGGGTNAPATSTYYFPGGVTVNGQLTWTGAGSGRAVIQDASRITVVSGGLLLLAGTNGMGYNFSGFLTNAGTVRLTGGDFHLGAGVNTDGWWLNLPGGLVEITGDNSILTASTLATLVNQGIVRKTGGANGLSAAGTSITVTLTNLGTLDAQVGTIKLGGAYDITQGTVNFGISGLNSYGIIQLDGSPNALGGTLSANFNNGFMPALGNTFALIFYNSPAGSFASLNLPPNEQWQTSYGPGFFTAMVTRLIPALKISLTVGDAKQQFQKTVTVSWPTPSVGFGLQTNSDLTTTNWAPTNLIITNDGTNKSITVTPPTGNLFFRLGPG